MVSFARKRKQAGFTFIELTLVLLILGTLSIAWLAREQAALEQTRLARVATDALQILQAVEGYFVDQDPQLANRWPADMDALVAGNYLPDSINPSLLGTDYVITPSPPDANGDRLTLTLTLDTDGPLEAERIAFRLPLGRVNGAQVISTIPRPGEEMMHLALYALDGSRPLEEDMNADGKDILNVGFIHSEAMNTNTLFLLSDARRKRAIRPITDDEAQRLILEVPAQAWTLDTAPQLTRYGPTAQDVQRAYPDLVHTDTDGTLSVDVPSLVGLLLANQQRQYRQMSALEATFAAHMSLLFDMPGSPSPTLNPTLKPTPPPPSPPRQKTCEPGLKETLRAWLRDWFTLPAQRHKRPAPKERCHA